MAEGLSYGKLVEGVRSVFNTGRTKTMQWRLSQLQATIRCLTEQKDKICKALHMDLRKVCVFLWYSCEIILILCYWKPLSSTVGALIVFFTWVVATLLAPTKKCLATGERPALQNYTISNIYTIAKTQLM